MRQAVNYYHWAPNPVKLRKMSYLQSGHPKPNGLWFDANGEWKHWCEAARSFTETLRYRHTVTILDDSRILFLKRARDIDAFTRKYGRSRFGNIELLQSTQAIDTFTRGYGRDLFGEISRQFGHYIVWGEVAQKYGGIIIVPYSHAREETYLWYYGWGCASGCVWDISVIRLGRPCRIAE